MAIERRYFGQEELAERSRAVQDDLKRIFMKIGDVPISDILTNDFLQKNSNFHSFREMTFSSMVWIDWNHDVVNTRKSLLDRFVAGSSCFSTWDEMFDAAVADYEERTGKKLCEECEGCSGHCIKEIY